MITLARHLARLMGDWLLVDTRVLPRVAGEVS
jgi:hypothetical protein